MYQGFIRGIRLEDKTSGGKYPFSIPAVKDIEKVEFESPVTFFVGENGTGKSTITEAVAVAAGFSAEGGTKNYNFSTEDSTSRLFEDMTLIRGADREKYGYFLRAESFYTAANYSEKGTFGLGGHPMPILFGGKHIHHQSHGEAFLAIVNSFRPGLFIFDEPESALSPQRLLQLISHINELVKQGSQFIIATHSPILLAYPSSTIYQLTESGIEKLGYENIEHVKLTRDFLNSPATFINKLLKG